MDTTHEMMTVTGEAFAALRVGKDLSPITVIGTEPICQTFGSETLNQAINSRRAPGVIRVVLNPDPHIG